MLPSTEAAKFMYHVNLKCSYATWSYLTVLDVAGLWKAAFGVFHYELKLK